jgi:RHS repeat-associated protein
MRSVGAETTTFVYDGWNQVREDVDDGSTTSTKHNVWGLDLSQSMQGAGGIGGLVAVVDGSGSASLFAFDGNGNVSEVLDGSTGQADAHYEYDAFGNVVLAVGAEAEQNPWRFSTKYQDSESGYLYYGLRYFDPPTGRWTRQDPLGERGGMNLYGFVGNGPNNSFDYLGLYQEAGHFYTAYAVAVASGAFTATEAFKLAYYAQLPDEVSAFDAITAGLATQLRSHQDIIQDYLQTDFPWYFRVPPEHVTAFGRDVQQWLHSLHGGNAQAVQRRRACLAKMLRRGDLATWQKGFIIHALGDAFSHTFYSSRGTQAYGYPVGHGLHGTDPDNIALRQDVYQAYVSALYEALHQGSGQVSQVSRLLDHAEQLPVDIDMANVDMGSFVRSNYGYNEEDFEWYRPEAGHVTYDPLPIPAPAAVQGLFREMKRSCDCDTE